MPLMPAPPMPTKWMFLTMCFIESVLCQGPPSRGKSRRHAGLPRFGQAARQARHVFQLWPRQAGQRLRQPLRGQCVLLHQHRGALLRQELRVGGLVVVHRVRKRYEQGRHTGGGHFGNRHRARAADDQVGVGVGRRHVVDKKKRTARCRPRHAGCGVVGAQCVDLLGAGLMPHHRPLALGQQRDGLRHHVVQRRRAQAAAHHQHAQRPVRWS